MQWTDRYLVSWSLFSDAATSRAGGYALVSLVDVRGCSFLSRLDTPVGRNTFLIVQVEICHFRLRLDSFRVKKVVFDTYIPTAATCKGILNYMAVIILPG